jgi:hypothetical protein
MFLTRVGSDFSHKYETKLEGINRTNTTLQKFAKYTCKSFITLSLVFSSKAY